MTAFQRTLFGAGPRVPVPPLGPELRRTVLAAGAWVDHRPAWIDAADDLFERLLTTIPWQAERRTMFDRIVDVPRLLAFYDSGAPLPDPLLDTVRAHLARHYGDEEGGPVATAGACLYRGGWDSVAWHGDRIGRGGVHDTVVAILSLGEPRRFLLRPRGGGPALRYDLGHGDLLVMGGSCQRTWEHAVPKTRHPMGPRISIQYRQPGVR